MTAADITAAETMVSTAVIDTDPSQPRRRFDGAAHDSLVASIETEGLLQPIGVRRSGDRFVVVYGERRLRAITALGWTEVPVRELSRDNSTEVLVSQLVENMVREDLHPIDEALAYRRLVDAGMTATEVGAKVGRSKGHVSHKLSLLKLPDPVRCYVDAGFLTEGQVRQLLRLKTTYGDSTITYSTKSFADKDDVLKVDAWPDEVVIAAAFIAQRPLAVPPLLHLPRLEGPEAEVISWSTRTIMRQTVANPTMPKWVMPVWFYASMLASLHDAGATVSTAQQAVELHEQYLTAAMLFAGPSPDADELSQAYLHDLRRAGFEDEEVEDWLAAHQWQVNRVVESGETMWPSSWQDGAPGEDARRALEAKRERQR